MVDAVLCTPRATNRLTMAGWYYRVFITGVMEGVDLAPDSKALALQLFYVELVGSVVSLVLG